MNPPSTLLRRLVLAIAPLLFVHPLVAQTVKLLADDAAESDYFGSAVAISADGMYAVVGATGDDGVGDRSGSAYVYSLIGGQWVEQAKLENPQDGGDEYFGSSVSISRDGGIVLVAAPLDDTTGAVHVFERTGSAWAHAARLVSMDVAAHDQFGTDVSVSGDGTRALIGAKGADGVDTWSGAAYVFARTGSGWQEEAKLTVADTSFQDSFGRSVSLSDDGRYALVGAPHLGGSDDAYVFVRNGTMWTEQAHLNPPQDTLTALFGLDVAISGDGRYAVVGASADGEHGSFSGAAYVFVRSGGAWSPQARLTASDAQPEDRFGTSVSLSTDGSMALIGASEAGLGTGIGSAYVFARNDAFWREVGKLEAPDGAPQDYFGDAVSLSGDGSRALVAAYADDHVAMNAGSAYVMQRPPAPVTDAGYAVTLGAAGFDSGVDVGIDGYGNAYFIGEFDGLFDFDPGPGTATMSSTQRDVYVVSFDASGNYRFGFQIGNSFPVSEAAGKIAVSHSGRFVVTGGQPYGRIDFDPDPTSEALRDGAFFLAGYEPGGTLHFAIQPAAANASSSAKGNAIALARTRNVYVAGQFTGTVDFEDSYAPASVIAPAAPVDLVDVRRFSLLAPAPLTSVGLMDAFVAGYTAEGRLRFVLPLGGSDVEVATGIAVDPTENVFVAGYFRGTVAFDPWDSDGNGNAEHRTSGAFESAFLAGYASDGTFRFVHVLGDDAAAVDVDVDASGNVYLAGSFTGTIRFDPDDRNGDGDLEERTERSGGSAFLASYRSDGTFRFALVLRGSSTAGSLATRRDGVSFMAGSFSGTVDFAPGPAVRELVGQGGRDVFVASYDSTGAFVSAFDLDGTGLDKGSGIAADPVGNVVLTGEFTGHIDLDPGPDLDPRTGAGQNDIFMAKFMPLNTAVAVGEAPELPARAILSPAYPNPFIAHTTLRLDVPAAQQVRVVVYDVLGRRIAVLYDGAMNLATPLELAWDARGAAPGIYLVRAEGETFEETRRVVRIR